MKGFRCGLLYLVSVALLWGAPALAAETLLRANDAGLHQRDGGQLRHGEPAEVRRLVTPDGQILGLALALQPRLMQDALRHVPAVREGTTQIYAGEVVGRAGSRVRLTRIGGAWLGAVDDGQTLWFLDPASHHRELAARIGVDESATLVYTLADLAQPLDFHGDTANGRELHAAVPLAPTPSTVQGGSGRELRVTLVMDTEFLALYPEPDSVAVATLNVVDGFYAAPVNTHVRLHYLIGLADNGPLTMTNHNELLPAFGDFVQASGIPFHGVAHLLSGKSFNGSVAGYAWLDALCNPAFGFGINQMTYPGGGNATILAHEMAHNFGVRHDNQVSLQIGLTSAFVKQYCSQNYIMAPSISAGNPATEFSACSGIWFDHYLQTQNPQCLVPVDLLFADDFEFNGVRIR